MTLLRPSYSGCFIKNELTEFKVAREGLADGIEAMIQLSFFRITALSISLFGL